MLGLDQEGESMIRIYREIKPKEEKQDDYAHDVKGWQQTRLLYGLPFKSFMIHTEINTAH